MGFKVCTKIDMRRAAHACAESVYEYTSGPLRRPNCCITITACRVTNAPSQPIMTILDIIYVTQFCKAAYSVIMCRNITTRMNQLTVFAFTYSNTMPIISLNKELDAKAREPMSVSVSSSLI